MESVPWVDELSITGTAQIQAGKPLVQETISEAMEFNGDDREWPWRHYLIPQVPSKTNKWRIETTLFKLEKGIWALAG